MEKQLKTIALSALSIVGIGLVTEIATASTLRIGDTISLGSTNKFNASNYNLDPELAFLSESSSELLASLAPSIVAKSNQQNLNNFNKIQVQQTIATSRTPTKELDLQNVNYYQNLVEPNSDQINLIQTRKLLGTEPSPELASQVANTNLDIPQPTALIASSGLLEVTSQQNTNVIRFPKSLLAVIILLIGWRGYYFLKSLGKSGDGGIIENLKDKYGNPKVPENAITLHNRYFKQLLSLGQKVEKIEGEKFGSQEFMLCLKLRQQVNNGTEEYQGIKESIQYLEVAIATQSSFLKLEQTESRYRSRKQQEFYNFVAETIAEDLDKDVFRNALKRKLAEIVPLLNSEEGRTALQSYIKEITKISEHNLGLKLFTLFKQHKVTNFALLVKVADIVNKIQPEELLCKNNLVVKILENYDVFENLAPIINIPENRISPETFATILQYMGLVRRQGNAMEDFERLSTSLKKWHKPYKSLMTVRQQYPESEYRLPEEFVAKAPGINIFKKYEPYIFDN